MIFRQTHTAEQIIKGLYIVKKSIEFTVFGDMYLKFNCLDVYLLYIYILGCPLVCQ